jgi:hypothetical protein
MEKSLYAIALAIVVAAGAVVWDNNQWRDNNQGPQWTMSVQPTGIVLLNTLTGQFKVCGAHDGPDRPARCVAMPDQ